MSRLQQLLGPRVSVFVAALLLVSLGLRLYVSDNSYGTNDIVSWTTFAKYIRVHGLMRTYQDAPLFNHPPLMGYYSLAALEVGERLGLRFSLVFKFPVILADVGTLFLFTRIKRATDTLTALVVLNPALILVSAYHGNTDCMCMAACIVSAVMIEQRRFAWAGVALAVAFNIKLVPAVLLLPFAVQVWRLGGVRGCWRFVVPLAVGVLPFVPTLVLAGEYYHRNALAYNSVLAHWGFNLLTLGAQVHMPSVSAWMAKYFLGYGKYVVLATAWSYGLVQLYRPRWNTYELGALAFACFLVFAPGFGIQYVVFPLLFLCITRLRSGVLFAWISGAYAAVLYFDYWTGSWPWYSAFAPAQGPVAQLLGFASWIVLLHFLIRKTAALLPEHLWQRVLGEEHRAPWF